MDILNFTHTCEQIDELNVFPAHYNEVCHVSDGVKPVIKFLILDTTNITKSLSALGDFFLICLLLFF